MEMAFFRLADRQGKTVSQVKNTTGSAELRTWMYFLEKEMKERKKDEWYHAQTASLLYSILRLLSGLFCKVQLPEIKDDDAFYIKFKKDGTEESPTVKSVTPELLSVQTQKDIWKAAVGL